jgi:hypothetical protein
VWQPSAGEVVSFRRRWEQENGTVVEGTDFAANGAFASILYSTYSEKECRKWAAHYNPAGKHASAAAFCKEGSDRHGARQRHQKPVLTAISQGQGPSEGETVCPHELLSLLHVG